MQPPASVPSGNDAYWDPSQPPKGSHSQKNQYSQPGSMAVNHHQQMYSQQLSNDPIVMQCQQAFEEALSNYREGNQFEYEKVCKQIHMRSLLKASQSTNGDARMQVQKLMNQNFLKFQMKEKEIKKNIQKRQKLEDDFKVLKQIQQDHSDKNCTQFNQIQQRDDLGQQFINKSRRKKIDPLSYSANAVQINEPAPAGIPRYQLFDPNLVQNQMSQQAQQHQSEVQRLQDAQLKIQNFRNEKMGQPSAEATTGQNQFMDRFSNDDYLQFQRIEVKKMQEQILRQQIHEKKMKEIQEKGLKHVEQVRDRLQVQNQIPQRQARWVKDHMNQSRYLNEDVHVPHQINQLANSNNIHEVMHTGQIAETRNPNVFTRPPRSVTPSPDRSHSFTRTNDVSRIGPSQHPNPVPIGGHYHFQSDKHVASHIHQNMQNQALDFVNVLKVLIEDTVLQQRRMNDEMFANIPRPSSYPYPQTSNLNQQPPMGPNQLNVGPTGAMNPTDQQNYHFTQQQQQQQLDVNQLINQLQAEEANRNNEVPGLSQAALQQANLLGQYMNDIDKLRQQREELLQEELQQDLVKKVEEDRPLNNKNSQMNKQMITGGATPGLPRLAVKQQSESKPSNASQPGADLNSVVASAGGFQAQPPKRTQEVEENKLKSQASGTFQNYSFRGSDPENRPIKAMATDEQEKLDSLVKAKKEAENQQKKQTAFETRMQGILDEKVTNSQIGKFRASDEGDQSVTKTRKLREAEQAYEDAKREGKRLEQGASRTGVSMFNPESNVGPNGEREIKLVVLPRNPYGMNENQEPKENPDVLGDSTQDAFNLAATVNPMPSQKLSEEILNKVSTQFKDYDDFMIFQQGLPPSMTPPLRIDQTTNKTEPNPVVAQLLPPDPYETQGPNIGQPLNNEGAKPFSKDHQITTDIDRVMKENFEYEQKTIENLFNRYQQYKPLVSGVYGQDVVQTGAHINPDDPQATEDLPQTAKEIETKYLIEVMKHNYESVNVTEKYKTMKDLVNNVTPEKFDITGGPEDGEDGNIEQPGIEFDAKQVKKKQKQILKDPKNAKIDLGDGDPMDEQDLNEEEKLDKKMKDLLVFPSDIANIGLVDSKPGIDSKEIQDRILSLKVMFDDSHSLRQKQNFLNTQGQNAMTNPEAGGTGLDKVRLYNLSKMEVNVDQPEALGTGVQGGPMSAENPQGNTRMISSIIKDIKNQKRILKQNQELKMDQDQALSNANPDVFKQAELDMPNLSSQANEINQYLPELVQLQQVISDTQKELKADAAAEMDALTQVQAQTQKAMDPVIDKEAWSNVYKEAMPLKNDFVFNFNDFENHKKEIHEKHLQRNAENTEMITEILAAKVSDGTTIEQLPLKEVTFTQAFTESKNELEEQFQELGKTLPSKTVLQQIEEQSLSLQINRAAEEKLQGQDQLDNAGAKFTYQLPTDDPDQDMAAIAVPEQPSYSFMAKNVFFEQLGDPTGAKPKADVVLIKQDEASAAQTDIYHLPEAPAPPVPFPTKAAQDDELPKIVAVEPREVPEQRQTVLSKLQIEIDEQKQMKAAMEGIGQFQNQITPQHETAPVDELQLAQQAEPSALAAQPSADQNFLELDKVRQQTEKTEHEFKSLVESRAESQKVLDFKYASEADHGIKLAVQNEGETGRLFADEPAISMNVPQLPSVDQGTSLYSGGQQSSQINSVRKPMTKPPTVPKEPKTGGLPKSSARSQEPQSMVEELSSITNKKIENRIKERQKNRKILASKSKLDLKSTVLEGGSESMSLGPSETFKSSVLLKSSVIVTEEDKGEIKPDQETLGGQKQKLNNTAEKQILEISNGKSKEVENQVEKKESSQLNELNDRKMQSIRRMNSMTSLERPESHRIQKSDARPRLSELPPLKDIPSRMTITPQANLSSRPPVQPPLNDGRFYVSQFQRERYSFQIPSSGFVQNNEQLSNRSSLATLQRQDSYKSVKTLQQQQNEKLYSIRF